MSEFFVKGKGWRYDFLLKGIRHYSQGYHKTKRKAQSEKEKHKERLKNPPKAIPLTFLKLLTNRLNEVQAYKSKDYLNSYIYMARRWAKKWGILPVNEITSDMVKEHILERSAISNHAANKDIRYLKPVFNLAKKKKLIPFSPMEEIEYMPVEKRVKYIPPKEDIWKVLALATPEVKDYLLCIKETIGRMGEINRLCWDDVNLSERYVTLYTRKKKGGDLTPRKVAMTTTLYNVLSRRYRDRDETKPWVFWHTYVSSKTGEKKEGPFIDRKKIMKTLCKRAGVKYFRFHALRHFGASLLDNAGVDIGAIQKVLGHEKRDTTEIYLQRLSPMEKEAMQVLEREGMPENEEVLMELERQLLGDDE